MLSDTTLGDGCKKQALKRVELHEDVQTDGYLTNKPINNLSNSKGVEGDRCSLATM